MSRPPPPGLSWAFPDVPAPGQSRGVAPGVHWLRMPLPFDLDHINLWLLEDSDGWTLVDTGAAAAVTRACWEEIFTAGRLGQPVRRIVITHFHPDHLGLAPTLAQRTGASVWMSELTWHQCLELMQPKQAPDDPAIVDFCARHEAAHPREYGYFCTGGLYRDVVEGMPAQYLPLEDGAVLDIGGRPWHVVMVGGHAEGHAVLHCQELNVVIAGDQVLPTITSNVSSFLDDRRAPDPLGNYLASFGRLAFLPDDVLVLPSHGKAFRGLHARIVQLQAHHGRTLAQVESLCAMPRTTGSLVPDLFPQVSAGLNYMLAFGETRAHVVHLRDTGRLDEVARSGHVFYRVT